MHKILLILLVPLITSNAFSKPKRFMFCLGQEEARIHKNKIGGFAYKLNQEMIGALVQLRESVQMKKTYAEQVCSANYSSIKLLELLMTKDDVFYSKYSEARSPKKFAIDQSNLDELKHESATLFIRFISQIQASLPKANCLQNKIPALRPFFEQMQFILQEVGLDRVMKTLDSPEEIFKKLQKLNVQKVKC
ncbi:MAG: hypothetical protein KC478_05655 [Bacteriovoracaceae bacterium]|nr:hypothetical protein [Bacteriovoracaceae bacterium]